MNSFLKRSNLEQFNFENLSAPIKYNKRSRKDEFEPGPYRNDFDRDRDRVLYSKAFRRLKGKTQVFFSTGADHLRTRLTHTLEVSQIARTISESLHLDCVLTEAIALGHDLGHTPFGHVGERTLNHVMNNCDSLGSFQKYMENTDKGFKHNWQGLRVVCDLEKIYGHPGLNLTNFTLWGILNHSDPDWGKCKSYIANTKQDCYLLRNPTCCSQDTVGLLETGFYKQYLQYLTIENGNPAWSFEGFIVAISDEIAQRHHDMEDALNAEIMDYKELRIKLNENYKIFLSNQPDDEFLHKVFERLNQARSTKEFLPYLSKFIVSFYTTRLIEATQKQLSKFIKGNGLVTRDDFVNQYPNLREEEARKVICFPDGLVEMDKNIIKTFLSDRILHSHKAQLMDGKGRFIIRRLFKAYITNPRQLYDSTILAVFSNMNEKYKSKNPDDKQMIGTLRNKIDSSKNKSNPQFQIALLRAICDNISGMTDDFAFAQHKELYG
jgi:dGTPase